jgi:hypothetical protein
MAYEETDGLWRDSWLMKRQMAYEETDAIQRAIWSVYGKSQMTYVLIYFLQNLC